ncbi:MAG TPA: hypothetical protein VEW42_02120 [Candidatus Eisenbacteria bacterium]|nr:hypothetical protein [Candidatus Eisenbacteria bacterium]
MARPNAKELYNQAENVLAAAQAHRDVVRSFAGEDPFETLIDPRVGQGDRLQQRQAFTIWRRTSVNPPLATRMTIGSTDISSEPPRQSVTLGVTRQGRDYRFDEGHPFRQNDYDDARQNLRDISAYYKRRGR